MQTTDLSEPTLREFYEEAILPQFDVDGNIKWEYSQVIGPDNDMHVFTYEGNEMALVFDDYPATGADDLAELFPHSHIENIPRMSSTGNTMIDIHSGNDKKLNIDILRFGPSETPFKYVHNVTGYFQLFKIVSHRKIYHK